MNYTETDTELSLADTKLRWAFSDIVAMFALLLSFIFPNTVMTIYTPHRMSMIY